MTRCLLYVDSHDVPAGTYVLEVSNVEYVFSPVRIDISAKEKKIKASAIVIRPGPNGAPIKSYERLSHPLALRPISSAEYFQKRVPYNVSSLLKNPMAIMMGVTLLMVVVFPKMVIHTLITSLIQSFTRYDHCF
jgi:hypothetical protein